MKLQEEIGDIRESLFLSDVTWKKAMDRIKPYTKKNTWVTPEWKKERKKLIKDHCEQCGTNEGIMVLQHLRHPQSFGQIFRGLVGQDIWKEWKSNYTPSERKKNGLEIYRKFQDLFGEIYGKMAVLQWIGQNERYLSMIDTATFCKKCAFMWDVKKRRLCPECKSKWCPLTLPKCAFCSRVLSEKRCG